MRIVAGRYGGRAIRTAPGLATRPTTDRVREAWASTTASLRDGGFAGARVLDAFAGSGALGLEALSRGAARVVFCENNRQALEALNENRAALADATELSTVCSLDVFTPTAIRQLMRLGPYDLVILDPPYATLLGKIHRLLR
ncbi:MAG: RsmD family RNA methyltransferase, partial [Coriobacteriales bacterium]|nr:RsmD family RNA methyltransferase [Coriobacteriales bacterium]